MLGCGIHVGGYQESRIECFCDMLYTAALVVSESACAPCMTSWQGWICPRPSSPRSSSPASSPSPSRSPPRALLELRPCASGDGAGDASVVKRPGDSAAAVAGAGGSGVGWAGAPSRAPLRAAPPARLLALVPELMVKLAAAIWFEGMATAAVAGQDRVTRTPREGTIVDRARSLWNAAQGSFSKFWSDH